MLALLCFYRISELAWVSIARYSSCSLPYLCYEWEMGAVHPVSEALKMEPVDSKIVLTGRCKRSFRTKAAIYRADPDFRMHTVPYVERQVRESLMLLPNKTEVPIEARMCLNRRRPAGALAPSKVPPLKTIPLSGQQVAVPTDPPSAPHAQPAVAPIELKGPLWESIAVLFVKFK